MKECEKDRRKFKGFTDKRHLIWAAPLAVGVAAAIGALLLLIIEGLWSWIVPSVFKGAVLEGYIVAKLKHSEAFGILLAVLVIRYLPGFIISQGKTRRASKDNV